MSLHLVEPSMKTNNSLFDRLDQAIAAVVASLQENNATLIADETLADMNVAVNYGETHRWDFNLETFKGKGTRKGLHVVIYRMASGRYELTFYFL